MNATTSKERLAVFGDFVRELLDRGHSGQELCNVVRQASMHVPLSIDAMLERGRHILSGRWEEYQVRRNVVCARLVVHGGGQLHLRENARMSVYCGEQHLGCWFVATDPQANNALQQLHWRLNDYRDTFLPANRLREYLSANRRLYVEDPP